jgi:hypothetical protein
MLDLAEMLHPAQERQVVLAKPSADAAGAGGLDQPLFDRPVSAVVL